MREIRRRPIRGGPHRRVVQGPLHALSIPPAIRRRRTRRACTARPRPFSRLPPAALVLTLWLATPQDADLTGAVWGSVVGFDTADFAGARNAPSLHAVECQQKTKPCAPPVLVYG